MIKQYALFMLLFSLFSCVEEGEEFRQNNPFDASSTKDFTIFLKTPTISGDNMPDTLLQKEGGNLVVNVIAEGKSGLTYSANSIDNGGLNIKNSGGQFEFGSVLEEEGIYDVAFWASQDLKKSNIEWLTILSLKERNIAFLQPEVTTFPRDDFTINLPLPSNTNENMRLSWEFFKDGNSVNKMVTGVNQNSCTFPNLEWATYEVKVSLQFKGRKISNEATKRVIVENYNISFSNPEQTINKNTLYAPFDVTLPNNNIDNSVTIFWELIKNGSVEKSQSTPITTNKFPFPVGKSEGDYEVRATLRYKEDNISNRAVKKVSITTYSVDADQELLDKVRLFYPFKGNSNDVINLSGDFHGTVHNSVSFAYDDVPDRDVALFGGSGHIAVNKFPNFGTTNFTITFWAKSGGSSAKVESLFRFFTNSGITPKGFDISIRNGVWVLTYFDGIKRLSREIWKDRGTVAVQQDLWYFFLIEYNGEILRFVQTVDDQHTLKEIGIIPAASFMNNISPTLHIGGSSKAIIVNSTFNGFHGKIKSVCPLKWYSFRGGYR